MSRSSSAACAAALLGQLVLTAPASAGDGREAPSMEDASRLFEHGAEQLRSGDYKGAAASYARADELVPDPAALEAALRASMMADDAVLGMSLAERANRTPPPPARLTRVVEITRVKFGKRVGRLTVRCAACTATVDAQPMAVNAPRWLAPGDHEVVIQAAGGRSDRRTLSIEAGASTDVVPIEGLAAPAARVRATPPPATKADATAATGMSPVWFWVALGTTVAAGGATVASAVDTQSKHEAFASVPSAAAADSGKAAETRTKVLAGVTAALGVATAGLGLFAVRWSAPRKPAVTATLAVSPAGASASLQTSF